MIESNARLIPPLAGRIIASPDLVAQRPELVFDTRGTEESRAEGAGFRRLISAASYATKTPEHWQTLRSGANRCSR